MKKLFFLSISFLLLGCGTQNGVYRSYIISQSEHEQVAGGKDTQPSAAKEIR